MSHSALGASNASRWINCPGSVEAEAGLDDTPSKYALEGTAAHALAEQAFLAQRDPGTWLGEEIEGVEVTDEMVEAVRVWLDFLADLSTGADSVFAERKVSLAPILPADLRGVIEPFGTVDFEALHLAEGRLDIADLKYGKGVRRDAAGDDQIRYYALAAWVELARRDRTLAGKIQTIRVHIVQPRLQDEIGEPLRTSEVLGLEDLKAWGRDLVEAMRRTLAEDAPRIAGEHCKFCKAKGTCTTFASKALVAAQMEFADVVAPEAPRLPAPADMTPEQLSIAMSHRTLLREWLDAIEGHIHATLEAGQPFPGWALAPKRATRKWVDEDRAVAVLTTTLRVDAEELYTQKLKSPAQMEKALGKGKIPEELIHAPSSGTSLVPEDHPNALPLDTAGSEFAALL